MTKPVHILLVFLLSSFALLGQAYDDFDVQVARSTFQPQTFDPKSIPKERLNEAILLLRDILSGQIKRVGTKAPSQFGARIVLFKLDDEVTIQKSIDRYKKYDSRDAWDYLPKDFERSGQPSLIGYLAGDFEGNEPIDAFYGAKGNEDEIRISVPPRSVYSGIISLRIIEKSDLFSDPVKKWAKDALRLQEENEGEFREMMRKWWKVSKDLFAQKRYKEVQPIDLKAIALKDVPKGNPESVEPISAEKERGQSTILD